MQILSASVSKASFFLYPKDQLFGFWDENKGGRALREISARSKLLVIDPLSTILQSSCIFAVQGKCSWLHRRFLMPFAEQKCRYFSFRRLYYKALWNVTWSWFLFLNTCDDIKNFFFPFLLPLDDLNPTKKDKADQWKDLNANFNWKETATLLLWDSFQQCSAYWSCSAFPFLPAPWPSVTLKYPLLGQPSS